MTLLIFVDFAALYLIGSIGLLLFVICIFEFCTFVIGWLEQQQKEREAFLKEEMAALGENADTQTAKKRDDTETKQMEKQDQQ